MFLPKQRKVMPLHSLPGFQLLQLYRQEPAPGPLSQPPLPYRWSSACRAPSMLLCALHGQLNGALAGSALQKQTLVQIGSTW